MDNPIVVIRRKAFETNLVVALTLATSHLLQPRRPAPPKATRRGIAPRVAALAVSELSCGAFFGKVLNCLVAYHDVVKFPLPTANTAQAQSPISIKKPHALLASSLFPLLVAGLAAGSGSFCTHTLAHTHGHRRRLGAWMRPQSCSEMKVNFKVDTLWSRCHEAGSYADTWSR